MTYTQLVRADRRRYQKIQAARARVAAMQAALLLSVLLAVYYVVLMAW